ncbi:adenylate/guanylate cyclase catalytic domain protein [Mycobacterium parascrofulaceum ATCC BAA-614]|uniref:Adenylate/guanylate cyclase catalytic domain protein n=1 Tax=Mycobacterium parascrofulaceum ATCC BAA-614 TaxID=525368 RepID=D5P7X8_9MYCO|nr:adenylate/guanylate cyclase catalytic domain protein [Mycobacterium parascrofulaceum ATCC BAA-614]
MIADVITLHLVELGVLGPLQVRQGGAPVGIPGAKPRAILTMLGLHSGSVVAADTLVELLWGEDPPRTAAKALQTHISSLRRTLGDGFVLTAGAGWTLAEAEVDAARYKSAARQGRDAAAAGDIGQALARFEEALTLWRGLPELPDGRRGTSEKTRWIEGHAALVEDRADALLATGRAAEIVGELEAAVAEAPLRERRWGQLMLALYRAGRQGEALGAYQRARALLADELGVDPGPDLRRLEAAIVAQDSALEMPAAQQVSSVTRAVTFLLTDIEGSTAAWEADAEAMAVALARHDELVEQVVTSRGGRLIKTRGEGDATFSVFERPSAAAAAAIEVQDAIIHEPWGLREPMRIRVALHTGEVELRDGDYFGRAVNRAARLRSLATGGQILCSGATAELVIDSLADDVVLADLGSRQLRNLARPEHVFELRLQTTEEPGRAVPPEAPLKRPSLPAVLAGRGPFVGREDELERLAAAWRAAVAGGTNAVLIAGEPGVGKTRLAGEWCRHAYDDGALVIYGRCDEDLGAPYQPFAEALRALVPCLGAGGLGGLRGVEALLTLVPGLADVVPDLAAPTRADPDTERYALFDAVVALLAMASASAPVVLVLDDLHWAAKPTLLLLRHLLRFGEHARMQIIGTYRSTDLDRSHPLAAMLADLHRDGTANRLGLSGLDEDDVTAYVAEAGYNDEELARALASVTGGNPFFLIEALRHVDESGGRWDQSTLPQGVREAVSRRLSRLPAEANRALAAAAVVGSRFALELVERVVGDDLVDAFDEACRAGIVIEEPGGRYRFNHAIVRQSLLAELPSVRRMRLHQRIATTLEGEPGAEEELLAELAYHYFECAWAGNAAKAVEYCRRAADQAMTRLAYEGAADLYDRALHALEEIDEELPDRDDQTAELLVARCEALLAAGDVTSAADAVSQLQSVPIDSARIAAWATCFDGQLSMLIHPERLDEVETAVGAAAARLAEFGDAAGEAKAHTVRAGCLARLGRIGDCEIALDDALTAARRAREHRRVNAVLANAPLAALWGPNPVPRAGGRCLDVVRLLRITTDSPAVEATSTRCQAVLEAFRGRAAAARRMIDSARRTVTDLGLRHALSEVEQFAGIVELVADEPAAAEAHLRKAYNGFRRMGLDADTAETAALLGRACLAQDRDVEAVELCAESERLAGHALKASIAWRTLRARLLSRRGDDDEARRVAEDAVALAERTDALVDHGDACLTLATVLGAAGDFAGARAAAERAVDLYERKGAVALAEKARRVLGERAVPRVATPPGARIVELDNACVRAGERVTAAINREAWDEFEQLFAADGSIESRRKIVGFGQIDVPPGEFPQVNRRVLEKVPMRLTQVVIAVRGERLALARLVIGADDVSPGAPRDEFLLLYGIDEDGQISLQVWFDVDDLDGALAELDAAHARFEAKHPIPRRLQNKAARVFEEEWSHFAARDWDALADLVADDYVGIDHRRVVSAETQRSRDAVVRDLQAAAEVGFGISMVSAIATRGQRLVLARVRASGSDPDAIQNDALNVVEIDADDRIANVGTYDLEDIDAAIAQLDARYLAGEAAPYAAAWSVVTGTFASISRREFPAMAPDCTTVDHRRVATFARNQLPAYIRAGWDIGQNITTYVDAVHRLDERGAIVSYVAHGKSHEGFDGEWHEVALVTVEGSLVNRCELFDEADLQTALANFDQLSRPVPRLENTATQTRERLQACFGTRDWDAMSEILAEDISTEDRRRPVNAGTRQGRNAVLEEMSATLEIGVESLTADIIATRGDRLALCRTQTWGRDKRPEAFHTDVFDVIEVNADGQLRARIIFDLDDIDAAFGELDTRYLRGEAAEHAHTWALVTEAFAALNQRTIPKTTSDWASLDHRRLAPIGANDLGAYLSAAWDLSPQSRIYIEAVHRLGNLGAVITHVAIGTSPDGFDAEWRVTDVVMFDGDRVSRSELFDDAELGGAIARFDQLSRPTCGLRNAASQAYERIFMWFAARDWDAMAEVVADDFSNEDRRRVVNAGIRHGRDAGIADMRAIADVGFTLTMVGVMATRGGRLALLRVRAAGSDPGAIKNDALNLVEVGADERVVASVIFELNDFDNALAELDARYLAGEAASHARTWSVIAGSYAALNRREPPLAAPGCVYADHRRETAFGPGDLTAYFGAGGASDQDINVYVEQVHRLSGLGAIVTYAARETREGFDAEWRGIAVLMVGGGLVSRCEVFDETELDAALARFDELQARPHRLDNAASQVNERFWSGLTTRDWPAMAEILAENVVSHDNRRVVNSGELRGRDTNLANLRAVADVGFEGVVSTILATRGQRLALSRIRSSAHGLEPGEISADMFGVVEIDRDSRMIVHSIFDADDFDAALAELDARYLAGEAASHAHTWAVITRVHVSFNRGELPPTDWVMIDHRRGTPFTFSNPIPTISAKWDLTPDLTIHVEAVHRLSHIGAVVTHTQRGTSPEGLNAEWRMLQVLTVEGDRVDRCELFDEADLDAAIARFEALQPQTPRLTNTASLVCERFSAQLAAGDWNAIAGSFVDNFSLDDRRRVVGAGLRHGLAAEITDLRTLADLGWTGMTSTVLATRGERVCVVRARMSFSDPEQGSEAYLAELIGLVEIDADERIVALVSFDLDDFELALAELEARYIAGEATAHAQTWSAITGIYAMFNRHELPAVDWVIADHRRATPFASGELSPALKTFFDLTPEFKVIIETVHRINSVGAVVTIDSHGLSQDGLGVEWRMIQLLILEGDRLTRCELFDESDLDTAIARFDQLGRLAPQLQNVASRVLEQFLAHFAAHAWDAMADLIAEDFCSDDRRSVINSGIRRGRDVEMANWRATAEVWMSDVQAAIIATRGERLALFRFTFASQDSLPEAFQAAALGVIEVNADNRFASTAVFDPDDIDDAFEELDVRYIAGEAAAHAHTWSVITRAYSAANRNELPARTPDWVNVDHRRGRAFGPGELETYMRSTWDVIPDTRIYIESVHRLSDLGALVTHAVRGTSRDGFDAEWREVSLSMVDGDRFNRTELFDETDLNVALARFDELHRQRPWLENPVNQRFLAYFADRDWDATAQLFAEDYSLDDRRRIVNAGVRQGRDAAIEDLRVSADVGLLANLASEIVATRGERLVLTRVQASGRDHPAIQLDVLQVVEHNGEQVTAAVLFDPEEIDSAFGELDARYLAGEAAPHAHTWSVIARSYSESNRHELPCMTQDSICIDHRAALTAEREDLAGYLRSLWDLMPDTRADIEAVHRLNDLGAVVTHAARGTSQEGFDAEWRVILVGIVEGDLLSRVEVFDESDLDAALARFEELQARASRLENAASRAEGRLFAHASSGDWAAMADVLAGDSFVDDRRRVVNIGVWDGRNVVVANMQALAEGLARVSLTMIATRGERLALSLIRSFNPDLERGEFAVEMLAIAEINTDGRIAAHVLIDADDLDAAFEELENRYLAGEAADHAHTWSVIAASYAAMNRRELFPTTPDWVNIDHRRPGIIEEGGLNASPISLWQLTANTTFRVEAVHRLTDLGAVCSHVAHGVSHQGFAAEWRGIEVQTVEGDLISRCEIFDAADLDAALARFAELTCGD